MDLFEDAGKTDKRNCRPESQHIGVSGRYGKARVNKRPPPPHPPQHTILLLRQTITARPRNLAVGFIN